MCGSLTHAGCPAQSFLTLGAPTKTLRTFVVNCSRTMAISLNKFAVVQIPPKTTTPVNANEEFCSVIHRQIGNHRVLLCAEIDCERRDGGEKSPLDGYVELKTSRYKQNPLVALALLTFKINLLSSLLFENRNILDNGGTWPDINS
mmetsp:Transcript_15249/g.22410  ORF Transcript_15249/g.22410 Transcript_15249/m.22410 type:complete len:146 (+) Transcript_15249:622-1059(+)